MIYFFLLHIFSQNKKVVYLPNWESTWIFFFFFQESQIISQKKKVRLSCITHFLLLLFSFPHSIQCITEKTESQKFFKKRNKIKIKFQSGKFYNYKN